MADLGHQAIDLGTLLRAEQITVSRQGCAGGFQHAFGFDTGFAQGAVLHVGGGGGKALAQHVCHLLVGQAIARLDDHRGFHA